VPPGCLAIVFAEFEADTKLAALSGPFRYYDLSRPRQALVALFYASSGSSTAQRFVLRIGSVVQGGNFVFRREAWTRAGGYDRSIAFYGEDADIAVRLARVGKVKWTFRLKMLSSGRRLATEGMVMTGFRYALNFLSVTLRGRPATKDYTDIRP